MKQALSPRLLECCRYISPGQRIADVGCDHGYLSIYLLKEGIASAVFASDINEGPLNSAVINAARSDVSEKISFYLSNGLQAVPRDFDVLVCAGMGAETTISILKGAPWLQSSKYRMVLQCQTKTHLLRRFLYETGWQLQEESIVRDGHFLYTVMNVIWQPGAALSPGESYLSPALLRHPGPELLEYYSRILEGVRQAVQGRGSENVPYMAQAYRELSQISPYCLCEEDHYDNCK